MYDAAFDWAPDDPRLDALADRTQRWLATRHRRGGGARLVEDPTVTRLAATWDGASSPAWERLAQVASQRKAGR
jgi:hypothetical protein